MVWPFRGQDYPRSRRAGCDKLRPDSLKDRFIEVHDRAALGIALKRVSSVRTSPGEAWWG